MTVPGEVGPPVTQKASKATCPEGTPESRRIGVLPNHVTRAFPTWAEARDQGCPLHGFRGVLPSDRQTTVGVFTAEEEPQPHAQGYSSVAALGPHTLLVAVPPSAPAVSPRGVVAAPERLAAPCPRCDTRASAFSGTFRSASPSAAQAQRQARTATGARRWGLLKTGRKVKGRAFYEPLEWHCLGVHVFEMLSEENRHAAGCC